jgi:HNH endonuclease
MSNSTKCRIVRGKPPKRNFTDNTYRKAKWWLMRDFQRRCAYSQQHTDRSLGEKTMEIDHFNPILKGSERNNYQNLFLATRHCNGSKRDTWPSKSARKKGIHFLNPCEEMDYGPHLVEHPVTHRLIGLTPSGDFHITACDLNALHLVEERRERAVIHQLLSDTALTTNTIGDTGWNNPSVLIPIKLLREQFEKMIPIIPYLSKEHPAYEEELAIMRLLTSSNQDK